MLGKESSLETNSVSILIPAYNVENYLERAVRSALMQENVKEIIIVDDGSKDNSFKIACSLAENNPLIRVYTHAGHVNKGLGATRNRGLEFASGEWIQLLDADDELLPGKISHHLAMCNDKTGFVVGNALDVFPDGRIHYRKYINDPWIGLVTGKLGISTANFFRASAVRELGGYNPHLNMSEEYDMMFRIMKAGYEVGYGEQFLTKINQTPNSLSRGEWNRQVLIDSWVSLRKQIRAHLEEEGLFNLKLSYYYSGAVGSFYSRYLNGIEGDYNSLLYQTYSLEKKIKIFLYQIFKKIYSGF